MPCVSTTLLDIEQSVARPALFRILSQIFKTTQLSEDTEIYYAGKRGTMQTYGSSIDDGHDRSAKFASGRYTFVEVTEEYDKNAMQETFVHAFEHAPIFLDEALRFSIRPVMTTSDVTIAIKYRSNSETEVRRWMAEMLLRTSRGRDISLHDIKYTYPLLQEYIELIRDVWVLREAVAPYGETLEQYIQRHSTDRLTILSNRAGEHTLLAVSETQTRIQGLFDFQGVPEAPIRDEATGTWELSFAYKFSYQRPDALFADFPVSVHNQILPDKYLNVMGKDEDPALKRRHYSQSYDALSLFELDTMADATRPSTPYPRLPDFDDFRIEATPPGSATAFVALCFLDEGRQTLLNLNDLGDYVVDKDLLSYFQGEAAYMTKLFHSFVHIALYKGHALQPNGSLEILSDLTVRSTVPLDYRAVYHVRIALMTDITLVVQAAYDRLAAYPKAFVKMLSALNELLAMDPDFNQLVTRNSIKDWEMKAIYRILMGGSRGNNYAPVAPLQHIPGDNIAAWSKTRGAEFLKSVDQDTIDKYFSEKRRSQVSNMITGIVVHSGV